MIRSAVHCLVPLQEVGRLEQVAEVLVAVVEQDLEAVVAVLEVMNIAIQVVMQMVTSIWLDGLGAGTGSGHGGSRAARRSQ